MYQEAAFLAIVGNRIIEVFVKPFFVKFKLDTFWLRPISWVVCGALSGLAGLNLFDEQFANPYVGVVLTAIAVGGGANFLDLFKK